MCLVNVEILFKVALYNELVNKKGMAQQDAMELIDRALLNYSDAPVWAKIFRSRMFGFLFITYRLKIMHSHLETFLN